MIKSIKVSPYKSKDLNFIKSIYDDIKSSEDFKYFFPDIVKMATNNKFFLLYVNNKFIGFYFLTEDSFGMYVVPNERRKGYGDWILNKIKNDMKDKKVIYANVTVGNEPAFNLYKKHHFITTHVGMNGDKPAVRMTFFPNVKRLNLGSGFMKLNDFLNIDINAKTKPDLIYDLRKGIPFEDDSIDIIEAKDFLEHLPREKTVFFWNEMYRVCKNNAKINIVVPYAGSDLYYADPTHMTGYRRRTFMEFTKPNMLMDYGGTMKMTMCIRDEDTQNIYVQMVVVK